VKRRKRNEFNQEIKRPVSDVIIEKTAGEFAGVFYDSARSSGMTVIKLQGKQSICFATSRLVILLGVTLKLSFLLLFML
jgi:hypothetical protein